MVWRIGGRTVGLWVLLVATSACSHDGGQVSAATGGSSGSSGDSAGVGGTNGGGETALGGAAQAGSTTGGTAGACPRELGECHSSGGAFNVCGGVVAADRFLDGSGFEAREGQRVVGLVGEAKVTSGGFHLFIGHFSGCSPRPVVYRFEKEQEGSCDATDDVFETQIDSSNFITSDNPGVEKTCDAFPAGWDLGIEGACFAPCGDLKIALSEGEKTVGDGLLLSLEEAEPFAGRMLAGQLLPGHEYKAVYAPTRLCMGTSGQHWEQTFTAEAARNVLNLDARGPLVNGTCP